MELEINSLSSNQIKNSLLIIGAVILCYHLMIIFFVIGIILAGTYFENNSCRKYFARISNNSIIYSMEYKIIKVSKY